MISLRGIYGVVLRYVFLYTRNGVRSFELFFWPLIHLMVWGYLSRYLMERENAASIQPVAFLIGGVLLWDIMFRATQGVSISFLEDIWTRNLLNLFVSPLRTAEMVAGMCVVGLLRAVVTLPVLVGLAWLMYSFNLLELKAALVPFFASLMIFGWSLGMLANSMVLRWGQAAEGLSWAVPFMVQPIAAIFYPVHVLPEWLQPVAWSLPCTHVFEAMRDGLAGEPVGTLRLVNAFALNAVWLVVASLVMMWVLRYAREKGLLVRVATQ